MIYIIPKQLNIGTRINKSLFSLYFSFRNGKASRQVKVWQILKSVSNVFLFVN